MVGGINLDSARPGYRHIIMRPRPRGDLTRVTVELHSIYGPIRSAWTLDAERGKFDWRITVPANTSATVYVPATASAAMREGDIPADEAPGVSLLRREADAAVYEVAAGEYHFAVESKFH